MCSQYWNLNTKVACLNCGNARIWNLQTHFMGDFGSCVNNYELGEKIDELGSVSVILDGKNDDFIGDCPNCGKFFNFGAKIVKGKVEKIFILREKIFFQ